MPRTRQLIMASLVLVIGIGFGVVLSGVLSLKKEAQIDYGSVDDLVSHDADVLAFKAAIETVVTTKEGKGDGGLTPDQIMTALPGVLPEDFSGVSAVLGQYDFKDGQLVYSNEEVLDGTAGDVVAKGYEVLRANVYRRLNLASSTDAAKAISLLQQTTATSTKPAPSLIPPVT